MSNKLPLQVAEDSEIGISFTLTLIDETLIDKTEPGEIFRFQIGDGSLLANLEELLIGLEVGTTGKFFVSPDDGFGFPDPMNVHTLSRAEFPAEMELKVGDVVGFDTPTGDEVPGMVMEINNDDITVDFNHPLAGETIVFEAKIEAIYS